jgi:hypothetical protein
LFELVIRKLLATANGFKLAELLSIAEELIYIGLV